MIDLHTHTNASDGTDTPEQLVRRAAEAGVHLLAMTDHDTLDGWEAARPTAAKLGVALIAGVELSTSLTPAQREVFQLDDRDIHLLAYFPCGEPDIAFREWVRTLEDSRWERNRKLLKRLGEAGIVVEEAELRRRGGSIAGRVHIARILRERNVVSNLDEAFRRYLGEDAETYVARNSPPIHEVLPHIRQAGGLSSLAHPIRVWGQRHELGEALAQWLAAQGLDALEAWHSEQSPGYSAWLCGLAQSLGLRVTGGSDFHGGNKPDIHLGVGRSKAPLVPATAFAKAWADAGQRSLLVAAD